ncbi:MAG: peptide ABC transporter substrate-binding protein [Vulcanimicrobiaceae bacterium]
MRRGTERPRRIARVALACIAALGVAACTKVKTASDGPIGGRHPWTKPGILRIGIANAPNTLDPLLASNTTESMVARLMFDNLVSVDATGTTSVPVLAAIVPTVANGGVSRDGLTITYHLRKNVLWHDGVPFTSKDVRFSWTAILNKRNNVISQTGYDLVRSVDTPDAATVVFHMKQRFSPAVDTLFGESDDPFDIVPEHILGPLQNINVAAFNASPIGTGPFKFKEWIRGDRIELVRNDRYFLGKPKLARIVLKFVPDENTQLNQLRTHDIDWQFEASPSEYRELKTIADVTSLLVVENQYLRVQINTKHPPLDDVRVRRAIAYGIDRAKLVDTLTYGSAAVADQDHPPFMWAHATAVPRYARDPVKARALLRAAGFTPGPDGIAARGGKKLVLEIVTNTSNATRRAAIVQIQSMLRDVGIGLEVKTYLGSLLFATMGQHGILQNGKFDLAITGWVAGIDPDQSSIFTCKAQPPNGNNETHYCNAQVDAAEEAALVNFDRPTRRRAYARIESMLARDVPEIPIWWPRQIQPINPDFKHFTPNPVTESWNAYTWDI